jgi:hypothetical protein
MDYYDLDDDVDDDVDEDDDVDDEDEDDGDDDEEEDDEDVETWQVFSVFQSILPLKPTLCLTSGVDVLDWPRFPAELTLETLGRHRVATIVRSGRRP